MCSTKRCPEHLKCFHSFRNKLRLWCECECVCGWISLRIRWAPFILNPFTLSMHLFDNGSLVSLPFIWKKKNMLVTLHEQFFVQLFIVSDFEWWLYLELCSILDSKQVNISITSTTCKQLSIKNVLSLLHFLFVTSNVPLSKVFVAVVVVLLFWSLFIFHYIEKKKASFPLWKCIIKFRVLF